MADKRRAHRVKSAFSAFIHKDDMFYCHCVIKDVSEIGMRLSVPPGFDLPETFEVKTPAIPQPITVKREWKNGACEIGVSFLYEATRERQANVA